MTKKQKVEIVEKRSLTSEENKAIEKVRGLGRSMEKDIFRAVSTAKGKDSAIEFAKDTELSLQDQCDEFQARILEASGSVNQVIGVGNIVKAGEAVTPSKVDIQKAAHIINVTAQAIAAMGPNDEFEGQLISQLVVLHEQAMTWMGKAMRTDRVDFANTYLNGASKLLTRHHETLAALLKYRRGGEQRVHVEHVHVHGGAQAIVGNVGAGGGLNRKNEEGPHAKV